MPIAPPSVTNVSRHCQMSSRGQSCTQLRNTGLQTNTKFSYQTPKVPLSPAIFPIRQFQWWPIAGPTWRPVPSLGTCGGHSQVQFNKETLGVILAHVKTCSGWGGCGLSTLCVAHTMKFKRKERLKCRTRNRNCRPPCRSDHPCPRILSSFPLT